jgi:dTDP-glucose 4,6-dehydratase
MGNKRLLVTGGAGFIGTNFIHLALTLRPDWDIVNLDALTYAGNPAGLRDLPSELAKRHRLVHGDIRDAALLENLFKKHAFNGVIHFAAESHVDRSIFGPDAFLETNIVGTFRLLEAGRKSWEARGKNEDFRFLHVSTDEVYGSLEAQGYFTELTPYDPSSPYSASKAASDHFARAYFRTYGLPTLITNCSNNFGPYQFPEKLIPLMILNIVDQKPLPIYGDGKNIRDWIYVVDHCKALITVFEKGHPGETYNVGGGSERENIEIVELLCDLVDSNLGRSARESGRRLIRFVEDRPGHDRRYAIDFTKIRETLGWRPESTLDKGLKATVAWYLTRMDWVNSVRSGEYLKWIDRNYGRRAPAFKGRPEEEG